MGMGKRLAAGALAATMAAMLAANAAQAAVNMTFVKPEKFRDDDFRNRMKRDDIIAEFRKYFSKLDRHYLKPGQTLDLEVLDIRLAGRYEPWRPNFDDVRILRDITPPSFRLRYTLRQGRRVVMRGEETVTDLSYLSRSDARNSSERFAYEKSMLRDWFRKRFVQLKAPRS